MVSVGVTSCNYDGSDCRSVTGGVSSRPSCDITHDAAVYAENSVHPVGCSLIQMQESTATPNSALEKVPKGQECDFVGREGRTPDSHS